MDWKLEVIVLPSRDLDRSLTFYRDQVGFTLDVDHRAGDFRVLQLTPPGSACSISFVSGSPAGVPSPATLQLLVADLDTARTQLTRRGVTVHGPFHYEDGVQCPGPHPAGGDYESFSAFRIPTARNGWCRKSPAEGTG